MAPNPLDLLARKLSGFAALSDDDRDAVLDLPVTIRTVESASYLVREGDKPAHCIVLLSGFAFRQKLGGDGARQIVAINIPGDPVDFQNLFLDVSDHNVQALTRSKVALIPRVAVERLIGERPAVSRAISVYNLVEAAIAREWILNVGRRDARMRMAHLLCEFALRLEAQGLATEYGYELPMTQEQLADTLGLTAVHVNRTLKALEADRLIVRSKRQITIPDWKALRDTGDFSDRYLHLALVRRTALAGEAPPGGALS